MSLKYSGLLRHHLNKINQNAENCCSLTSVQFKVIKQETPSISHLEINYMQWMVKYISTTYLYIRIYNFKFLKLKTNKIQENTDSQSLIYAYINYQNSSMVLKLLQK